MVDQVAANNGQVPPEVAQMFTSNPQALQMIQMLAARQIRQQNGGNQGGAQSA